MGAAGGPCKEKDRDYLFLHGLLVAEWDHSERTPSHGWKTVLIQWTAQSGSWGMSSAKKEYKRIQ